MSRSVRKYARARARRVFLDRRRLQDGRNFQDDYADALVNTSLPVVILSTAALQRMVKLKADSAIDNLLLEWTIIVELLHSKTIEKCLPIIIRTQLRCRHCGFLQGCRECCRRLRVLLGHRQPARQQRG
jgi:hypothetical protein